MSQTDENYLEALRRINEARKAKLSRLDLSRLSLSTIPSEVVELINLSELNLSRNQLDDLPNTIGKLASLTSLDLGQNRFSSLPSEADKLTQLTHLDLRDNQLYELPLVLTSLTNLVQLVLKDNQLRDFPVELTKLINLRSLDLSNNQIESIPSEVGYMANLFKLNLSSNRIKFIPEEIGFLIRLEEFFLRDNDLVSLPTTIGSLAKLRVLYLNLNRLQNLPTSITQLSNLNVLFLHDNQFRIPPEVIGNTRVSIEKENTKLIFGYLDDLKEGRALNETKMLIVGEGAVGKTSLIQRLINDEYDELSNKTEGIDIRDLTIELPDKRHVKVNIWDFGGQEVMHATHQFFLTQRSIYLYVLDARRESLANRPDYWLNLIEQYGGGDAPIILVVNKIDDNPILSLNEASLKRKYNIAGIHHVSCATGEGLENLRTAIYRIIEELPYVSDNIPPSWDKVKKTLEIERTKKDIIEYMSFSDLCEDHGVNEFIRPAVLRLFHDLGTVLNFYQEGSFDAAEDTKILNPEWVTDGVYAVINSIKIFKEKGVLEKSELRNILDPKRYPTNATREFILGMMEQFELAYPFDSGKRYLVPDLLSEIEPTIEGFDETLNFEYRYQNFMPPSVISRFIVRQHEKIKNREAELWKNGVVIHFEKMQALIRAEMPSSKVTIAVQGDRNRLRELLAIVRDTFDSIHGSFAKLRVQAMVPIPDEEAAAVSYKALLAAEREGRSDIYVEDLDEYLDVRPLLEGVDGAISNRRLFNTLRERFSEEDIRTALFEIGIDHEAILSQYKGKTAYARETVLHLERSGKIDAFVGEIRKSRPDIDF